MRGTLWTIAAWLSCVGLYLALAGSLGTAEVVSAVVAATFAALLGLAMALAGARRFTLSLPARAVLRPLASLLPDFVAVGRVLLSPGPQQGDFVRQPFQDGGSDGRSALRRAAAVIGISLAPRSFVVRCEDDEALLLHCLPTRPASPDDMWPA